MKEQVEFINILITYIAVGGVCFFIGMIFSFILGCLHSAGLLDRIAELERGKDDN